MKGLKSILDYAMKYLSLGYSIIPVGKDKKPLIKWEAYQKRKATENEVRAWWMKWPDANIGIVTGKISNLAVIDVDTVEGNQTISKIIPDSVVKPTSTTPKDGQHLYHQCPDDKLSNNSKKIQGCDLRANGGYVVAPPSVNGTGKEYRWLEGFAPWEVETPALPKAYLAYINNNNINKDAVTHSVTMFVKGRRDDDLFHVANCLTKGRMPYQEIKQVIDMLAKYCNPPFPSKEVETKIMSALKRSDAVKNNLTREVERWISVTDGDFSVTDCDKATQSVTGVTIRDKSSIRKIFQRLRERGVIQKVGNKDGVYRKVEIVCDDIDFLNAPTEPLAVHYPLRVHEYCLTYPKNIIVIAGTSNSGKTAFLLDFCRLNMDRHRINYFSSEMGAIELKDRLIKFDITLYDWTKVKFKERSANFSDVIVPDEINIVDYLEVTTDFWQVAGYIKEIFDKLNKGICLIALQKNKGAELGLGGGRSIEKARLYLTMESNRLKIEKGKNWVKPDLNPNGLLIEYKLVQGAKFIEQSDWIPSAELEQYEQDKKQGF
jgi:hypothetical protein